MTASIVFLLLCIKLNECASLRKIKKEVDSILEDVKHIKENVEKDIGLPDTQSDSSVVEKRNAVHGSHFIWWTRNIPVAFDSSLKQSSINDLVAAVTEFQAKTCLRFYARGSESNYVKYHETTGTCSAPMGNGGSYQPTEHKIYIGSKCGGGVGIALHETMHTLGFKHEFQRPDRDTYLISQASTMAKGSAWEYQTFGAPYDYDSVMNYYSYHADVTVRNDPDGSLTSRLRIARSLSTLDAYKINQLYQCGNESSSHPGYTEWNNWSGCFNQGYYDLPVGTSDWRGYNYWQNQCKRSRQRYCFSLDLNKCTLRPGTFTNEAAKRIVTEVEDCDASACDAVVDGWTSWSSWGGCTVTCGGGRRSRNRDCPSLAPENGDVPCVGDSVEYHQTPCNDFECYQAPTNGGCDFESGWCADYSATDTAKWKLGKADTPTRNTGPTTDHTRVYKPILGSNGQYVYFEATGAANGVYAIYTPSLQGARCMSFWYHMYGNAGMQVGVGTQTASGASNMLLHLVGSQGDEWKQGTLDVNVDNGESYYVYFAVVRAGDDNDVAFDDISFSSGPCAGGSKREVDEVNVDDEIEGYSNLMKGLFEKKKSGEKNAKNDEVDGYPDLMRSLFNKKKNNGGHNDNHE